MSSWLRAVWRRLRGERRHRPRQNAEKVRYVNERYAVAVRLARKLGGTPEDMIDGPGRRARLLDELQSHRR